MVHGSHRASRFFSKSCISKCALAIWYKSRWANFRTITLVREERQTNPWRYRGVLLCASFSAVSSASAALTFTSGSTPVPSQSGLPYGLTGYVSGIPMPK